MVEFILGTAGSGKSTLISKRIADDLAAGKKVLFLVPEQTAINAEEAVCSEAQRRGIPQTELEVLNFKRLCNRVFREYGGIAYHSVSPGAKALILWQALFSSVPVLRRYKTEFEDIKNFIPLLLATVSEFKAYNITPERLNKAAEEAGEDNPELADKLTDLAVIFAQFDHFMKKGFHDPSDDLSRATELLKSHRFFEGISLYIDSFSGFTPQEYEVLSIAFRQAETVTVALCLGENGNDTIFENVRQTFTELKKLAERAPEGCRITRLTDPLRFHSPALVFLERNLWRIGEATVFEGDSSAVRTVVAPGIYDEAEFIANDIIAKVQDGASYRDFAVIVGNMEDYRGVIDAVFQRFGIPCHISVRTELSEKPLFKLILSAFDILIRDWKTEDVIILMKTGLSPLTTEECYELEHYVRQWNIFGRRWYDEDDWFMNPDGYTDLMTEEGDALLRRVNASRRKLITPLQRFFESLDGSRTVETICRELYSFLVGLKADEKIAATGSDDEIRVWNSLCGALDTLSAVLPDLKANSFLFFNLFSLVVRQTNVGSLPSVIDEVTVGSADNIRTNHVRHVYTAGVNEGSFPASVSESGLFSDNDKAYLETCGITLSPDSNLLSVSELYNFYAAVCCASDSVTVLCASADTEGNALYPSVAFLRIRQMFPQAEKIFTDKLPLADRIRTKSAAFDLFAPAADTPEGAALASLLAEDPEYAPLIENGRQGLITAEERLDDDTAAEIFRGNLALTQSRLDNFALCAFGYECNYVLNLKPRRRYEFRASDTGTLIHRILEKFFTEIRNPDGTLQKIGRRKKAVLVDGIIEDYLSGIFGPPDQRVMSERAIQLFVRLRRAVSVILDNLMAEFSHSDFVPRFFEMKITDSDEPGTVAPLRIPLPNGQYVSLYGIIDRVDLCKKGDDVYVRVVDYKTGHKTFSLSDLSLGLNLQLLIYLFSIWKDRDGRFARTLGIHGKIIPAGVLYSPARIDSGLNVSHDVSEEEILLLVNEKLKRMGIVLNDLTVLDMMEKNLTGSFLPVTRSELGKLKATDSLIMVEEFGHLLREVSSVVARLAAEMQKGEASAVPLKTSQHDACRFCRHRFICRNPIAFINSTPSPNRS